MPDWRSSSAVFLATCLVVMPCGCKRSNTDKTESEEKSKDAPPVPVEVAPVMRGPIESTIKTYTHLEAEEEVKVFARTSNRVAELMVEEGDQVAKDQVLLRLDNDIQKTQVSKAQARLDKARQEFARQEALFQQQLISEQVFGDTRHELRQLELALEDAQRELAYAEVRAPIGGTVSRRMVKYGDLVTLNQHLFDLVDFNSLVARVYVPEKHLVELATNQVVRVRVPALANREFAGFVKRIAPVVEYKSGLVKVTVAFRDIGALRPGLYVDAEIVTAAKTDALLLSKRSLVYDGDQVFAFRVQPDRRVQRLMVEPRLADRFNLEPRDNFKEGDLVVIAGQTGLRDRARVKVQTNAPPTTALVSGVSTNAKH